MDIILQKAALDLALKSQQDLERKLRDSELSEGESPHTHTSRSPTVLWLSGRVFQTETSPLSLVHLIWAHLGLLRGMMQAALLKCGVLSGRLRRRLQEAQVCSRICPGGGGGENL